MLYLFEHFVLDDERRELRTDSSTVLPVGPQVFDLLVYLIENRERVVSKDDLIASSGAAALYPIQLWTATLMRRAKRWTIVARSSA